MLEVRDVLSRMCLNLNPCLAVKQRLRHTSILQVIFCGRAEDYVNEIKKERMYVYQAFVQIQN